jgi:hypothetical protein
LQLEELENWEPTQFSFSHKAPNTLSQELLPGWLERNEHRHWCGRTIDGKAQVLAIKWRQKSRGYLDLESAYYFLKC